MHVVSRNGVYRSGFLRDEPFKNPDRYVSTETATSVRLELIKGYQVAHKKHAGITTIDVMGEGIGFEDVGRVDAWQQFHQWADDKLEGENTTYTLVPEPETKPEKKRRMKMGRGATAEDIFRSQLLTATLPTEHVKYSAVSVQYSGYGNKWRVRYGPRRNQLNFPGAYTNLEIVEKRKTAFRLINEEIDIRSARKKEIACVRLQALAELEEAAEKKKELVKPIEATKTRVEIFKEKLTRTALPRKPIKIKDSYWRFRKSSLNINNYEVFFNTTVQKKKVYIQFGREDTEAEARKSSLLVAELVNEEIHKKLKQIIGLEQ